MDSIYIKESKRGLIACDKIKHTRNCTIMLDNAIKSAINNQFSSSDEFPVDFDIFWQWLGYSRKDSAKRAFDSYGFIHNINYRLHEIVETKTDGSFSHIRHEMKLTIECAKLFSMTVNSEQGNNIRNYYLECEKLLKQPSVIFDNKINQIAKRLQEYEIESTKLNTENKKKLEAITMYIIKQETGIEELEPLIDKKIPPLEPIELPKKPHIYVLSSHNSVLGRPKYANKVKRHELTPENFAPQILHNLKYNQIPAGIRSLTASELSKRLSPARELIKEGNINLINNALDILAEQGFIEYVGLSSADTRKYKINVPKVNSEVK